MQNHAGRNVDAVAFIKQLDPEKEIKFDELPERSVIRVQTRNSLYTFRRKDGGFTIHGGRWFSEHLCKLYGSTFGGSMILMHRIVVGAYMEFEVEGDVYHSSGVRSVEVERPLEEAASR